MATHFPKESTWHSPRGPILVCRDLTGRYLLYTEEEWESAIPADLEADDEGHVMQNGKYVDYDDPDWVIPPDVLENALD